MSHNISDELYNQIVNTNSPNELWELKNLIINNSINENDSNKNSINIRSLSINEYNKYIINDTLKGSITNNNINVWRHQNFHRSYRTTDCNYACAYTIVSIARGSTNNVTNLLSETLQNNSNQNNVSLADIKLELHNYDYYRSSVGTTYSGYGHDYYNLLQHNISKSQSTLTFRMSATAKANYTTTVILNGTVYMCFRPIFQYIDNKKSNNIFN